MDLKTYLKVSIINLLFLLLGLALGIAITTEVTAVHAQTKQAQATDGAQISDSPTTKVTRAPQNPPLDPNAEYVSPGVSLGGPVVTNTFLASRIACDRLQVNGFDPLRLDDALLSALARKGIFSAAEIQSIIDSGKAEHPLRIKPQ
jgi:hypothetical protein